MKYAIKTKTRISKVFILTIFNVLILFALSTVSSLFTSPIKTTLTLDNIAKALPDLETSDWKSVNNHTPLCASKDLELLHTWQNKDGKEIRISAEKTLSDPESIYAEQVKNYGHCPSADQYLVQTYQISGLGTTGTGISLAVKEPENIFHILTVKSSSEIVTISSKDYSVAELAKIVARIFDSQCPNNSCHSNPVIENTTPLEANPPGWLNAQDIPLSKDSESYWYAANIDNSFDTTLSSCELLNLGTVSGPKTRNHRALVLVNSKSDKTFGIDQFILTFATKDEADEFYQKLDGNLKKCTEHFKNTKITANEVSSDSSTYNAEITTEEYKILARMGLMKSDNKVSYLYNNSSDSLQFTEKEWLAITNRAASRLPRIK